MFVRSLLKLITVIKIMPRDYVEVERVEDFVKVCEKVDIVLRIDPLLIANYYGIFVFIDLRRLSGSEIKKLISSIKDKVIHVRRHTVATSVSDLT